MEMALFERALYEIVESEYSPREDGVKNAADVDGPIEDEIPFG